MYNLLEDALISISLTDGERTIVDLPSTLHYACSDLIASMDSLRPHQWQAWHCFATQLGAMALDISGRSAIPDTQDEWRECLRKLTPEWTNDEPWHLIGDLDEAPAFMQFSIQKEVVKSYKRSYSTPDELDMLITSKNHDLKSASMTECKPEDWLYSLICLQTTEGFLGRGNYGISRMNGGFASRSFVGLAPQGGLGAHIRRDIVELLDQKASHTQDFKSLYGGNQTRRVLWIEPWNGKTSTSFTHLHPYYIEVCRRVRLKHAANRTTAVSASSDAALLDAKQLNGYTGDPWAPTENSANPKSLTATSEGFTYRRIVQLLDSTQWKLPILAKASKKEHGSDMTLVLNALTRGQGRTEGLHQRRIPLTSGVTRAFGRGAKVASIGVIAQDHLQDSNNTLKYFRRAVEVASAGAPGLAQGKLDFEAIGKFDKTVSTIWYKQLDARIDAIFFDHVWQAWDEESGREKHRERWIQTLFQIGKDLLAQACNAIPLSEHRKLPAAVGAQRIYIGSMYKEFPSLKRSPAYNDQETETTT